MLRNITQASCAFVVIPPINLGCYSKYIFRGFLKLRSRDFNGTMKILNAQSKNEQREWNAMKNFMYGITNVCCKFIKI